MTGAGESMYNMPPRKMELHICFGSRLPRGLHPKGFIDMELNFVSKCLQALTQANKYLFLCASSTVVQEVSASCTHLYCFLHLCCTVSCSYPLVYPVLIMYCILHVLLIYCVVTVSFVYSCLSYHNPCLSGTVCILYLFCTLSCTILCTSPLPYSVLILFCTRYIFYTYPLLYCLLTLLCIMYVYVTVFYLFLTLLCAYPALCHVRIFYRMNRWSGHLNTWSLVPLVLSGVWWYSRIIWSLVLLGLSGVWCRYRSLSGV